MKRILIFTAVVFWSCWGWSQTIETYQPPASVAPAPDFSVKINGKESFVYDSEVAAFTNFSFEGTVTVDIVSRNDIKWLDIRPLNENIQAEYDGNHITFQISQPAHLSLELNGESIRPLYIFANPMETNVPDPNDPNVRFFSGGKVYNTGTLNLKDNQTVYIAGGAIVKGNLKASQASNIKIRGRGILDGSDVPEGSNNRMIMLEKCENSLIEGILIFNSLTWTVVPVECNNLEINNIKQINWDFGSDGIDLVGCTNIDIKNCFLRNNDDCIVIKSFDYADKYQNDPLAGRPVKNINVTNTVFWNMAWGNAIEIGFELRTSSISDVTFRNCDIIHVERGAAFSIHNGDRAVVENIRYENIRVENARHKLIDLAIFLSQYSLDRPASEQERQERYLHGAWDGVQKVYEGEEQQFAPNRGYIRNISFKDIAVLDGPFPFSIIAGYSQEHQVENVMIENLTILGNPINQREDGRFFIENAENIIFIP